MHEKKELLHEKEQIAKENLEDFCLLKNSPCVSNALPPFTPQKNDSAGKAPRKKMRISDQQMCNLDSLEKKKFLSGLYGGMKDTDFVVVCEFMPNGNIAWNAQAFGSFGGVYRSTLNGVHLLKRPSGEHSIFPKDLLKDLETNFKLASCRWFASGGQMPWGHSEDKNEVISQRLYSIPDHCFDIYKAHQLSADYGTSDEMISILSQSLDHLKSVCIPCFDTIMLSTSVLLLER